MKATEPNPNGRAAHSADVDTIGTSPSVGRMAGQGPLSTQPAPIAGPSTREARYHAAERSVLESTWIDPSLKEKLRARGLVAARIQREERQRTADGRRRQERIALLAHSMSLDVARDYVAREVLDARATARKLLADATLAKATARVDRRDWLVTVGGTDRAPLRSVTVTAGTAREARAIGAELLKVKPARVKASSNIPATSIELESARVIVADATAEAATILAAE